jgi:hypothetical protein
LQLAAVGPVDSTNYFPERGLARTVLADEGVDLALCDRERDVRECMGCGESLTYVL